MTDTEKRLAEIEKAKATLATPSEAVEMIDYLLATVRDQADDLRREKKYRLDDERELARMDDVEYERDGWKGEFESLQRKYNELKGDTCLKRYRLLEAEAARLRKEAIERSTLRVKDAKEIAPLRRALEKISIFVHGSGPAWSNEAKIARKALPGPEGGETADGHIPQAR